jgi:hypothetical protein
MDLASEGEPPKALLDKPDMRPGLVFFYEGFWALSGDRQTGMGGAGPISFGAIDCYARRAGITGRDDFERFRVLITRMDQAYLKHVNAKEDDSGVSDA